MKGHGPGPRRLGNWPPRSLLGSLEPATRDLMLRLGTATQFGAGETLLREGDPDSRHVLLLIDACVKVVSDTADGHTVLLAIRTDGDLVGELASLDGQPRVASVIAVKPSVVRRIGQGEFLDFLDHNPAVSRAVYRVVTTKLRNSTWHRIEYGSTPAPLRLARVLVQLAAQHGERVPEGIEIRLALTQPDLAALAGAREPTVHKELRALRHRGVVETGYRRILISDPAALHAIAGISEIPPEYGVWPAPRPQGEGE
ncbi:Crp/Fnr family transcriptional regulator [Sphaerisporangium sp. NPDC051011]|uniref:Crp/Fnr family transcriptional regulator n=1 Tax=Sphaerisporangium sp. NPDC051011 TaxID=3155792 RepID=UPI0033D05930